MSFSVKAVALAALMAASAGVASAQPYYGYGELPPPPYQVVEGGGAGSGGGGCSGDFTLLGANAGVTVLGLNLGAGAGLNVPTHACGGGEYGQEAYVPRAPAPDAYGPPPGYGYPPPGYARPEYGAGEPEAYGQGGYGPPPGYEPQGYAAPGEASQPYPCGCETPRW